MKDLKFKVKVIAISLKGNKIAKCGDLVSESQLPGNNAEILIKEGYLEHTKASKKAFEADKAANKDNKPKKLTEKSE